MSRAGDLSLTLEDLFADKGKFKLNLSFACANRVRHGVSSDDSVLVQTSVSSFEAVPGRGESNNNDSFVRALSLRRGITSKAGSCVRVPMLANRPRSEGMLDVRSSGSSPLSGFWIGASYQFTEGHGASAAQDFEELLLRSRRLKDSVKSKSASLGVTAYTAIAAVIFAVTGTWRIQGTFPKTVANPSGRTGCHRSACWRSLLWMIASR